MDVSWFGMDFWMNFKVMLDGFLQIFWMDVFFFDFWEEKCEGEVEAEMNLTVHFVLWVILSAKFHESNISVSLTARILYWKVGKMTFLPIDETMCRLTFEKVKVLPSFCWG